MDRRGWSGWWRRTGQQTQAVPNVADVRLVADESELAAALVGPRASASYQHAAGEGEFPTWALHAGTRGCWARFLGTGDPSDLISFAVIPFRTLSGVVIPWSGISEGDWLPESVLEVAIVLVDPMAANAAFVPHAGFVYGPEIWVGPGRTLLMTSAEVQTVALTIIIREPGSAASA